MKYLICLALLLMTFSKAWAGGFPDQSKFQESLTHALKTQDRAAFYRLVCFDGCDKNWVETNKMVFEENFKEAAKTPRFAASIVGGSANVPPPLPTQHYNIPVAGAYLMHLAPGLTMNLPLGLKDGALKVPCVILKDEAPR